MFFLLIGLLLSFSLNTVAVERIATFHSDIVVHADSSMTVRETIDVVSEVRQIRHGIVREFPIRYNDRWGNNFDIGFSIKSILLDGKPVSYQVKEAYNGWFIYIGEKDVFLRPGKYSYVIEYVTKRQLGFFETHDELYWNVTGTGWRLPIDHASARVHLPCDIPSDQIHVEGYTGYQGSKAQQYEAKVSQDGIITFETTQPLKTKQGLTIVVTWPKGCVSEPSLALQWWWFFLDNKHIVVALLGLLLLLLLYLFVSIRFFRSQQLGTVIPLFYPPKQMSPGCMRYFMSMGYDAKVLAADIVNMAVRGFIMIKHEPKLFFSGSYTLEKKEKPREGPFESVYRKVYDRLFVHHDAIRLSAKNQEVVSSTIDIISGMYNKETKGDFQYNWHYTMVAVVVALCFGVTALGLNESPFSGILIFFYIGYAFIIGFCTWLLRGYTPQGLAKKREIEGFKMFLSTTEEERFKIIGTPPTRTPELYETYLPYAIALGVEKQWSQQFAPLFERMVQAGTPFVIIWVYGGRFDRFNASSFASNLSSSISSSIASSSTPPGKSSGFGGRGSSGGGGGGGGGGGW